MTHSAGTKEHDCFHFAGKMCYNPLMNFSLTELAARRHRRREAIQLHRIEGYEFSDDDNAMFEMFDREGFTDEERIAYIREQARKEARTPQAAE